MGAVKTAFTYIMEQQTQQELTLEDALQALRSGAKVSHRFFGIDEYMFLPDIKNANIIQFEDGVKCFSSDFFKYRSGEEWKNGWYIWKEKVLSNV